MGIFFIAQEYKHLSVCILKFLKAQELARVPQIDGTRIGTRTQMPSYINKGLQKLSQAIYIASVPLSVKNSALDFIFPTASIKGIVMNLPPRDYFWEDIP